MRAVTLDAQPLDVWTAIAEVGAAQGQFGSRLLYELVVVSDLRQRLAACKRRGEGHCKQASAYKHLCLFFTSRILTSHISTPWF